jgi:hypothetical protein
MKKVLICFALLLMAVSVNAQNRFGKGDWFVGVQIPRFDLTSGSHAGSNFKLNINAMGGWFFSNKFAIDVMAGVSHEKSGDKADVNFKSATNFVFGAGVRYYPVGNLFARVGYIGQPSKTVGFTSYIDVKVGYDVFASKRVLFEPTIYYERGFSHGGGNAFGLSLGIGVKL